MKHNITLLLLVVSTTFFAQNANYNTKKGAVANGYDVVEYFNHKTLKGAKKYATTYDNVEFRFSSQKNLDTFIKAPTQYIPQYGGYCAYAMSDGRLVGVDEDAFTIVDGKLYLNYSKSVMKEWRKEQTLYIEQADALYPTLVDLPQ